MKSAAEILASGGTTSQRFEEILRRGEGMTLRDFMTRSIQRANCTPGRLHEEDGIDCPLCLNRGYMTRLNEESLSEVLCPCACMTQRQGVMRLKKSGLGELAAQCSFESFRAESPWQGKMLSLARDYVSHGCAEGRWMFLGGQPGCGKTHLMTAACAALLKEQALRYEVWPEMSRRLKANVNESAEYDAAFERLRRVPVLAIDDFLKPVGGAASQRTPSAGDLRLAFELISARANIGLSTLISSEWLLEELAECDEALAGRIRERCGEYALCIGRDVSRDYRMRKQA